MSDLVQTLPQPVFSRSFGSGPRQMLAVHCSLAHSGTWRGFTEAMEGAVTVSAFDLLSHGRSPDWDGEGDYQDRNTEAGLSLMPDEPVDLIGHSFGATVVLRMALARPEKVRSLILIEPVLFRVALEDDPEVAQRTRDDSKPFMEAFAAGDAALAARLFNRAWSSGAPRWPDLPEATRDAMTRAIHIVPACDAAVYQDRPGVLRPGVLQGLDVPVLLLRGSETQPVIAVVNEGLAQRLPNARSEVIAGAGHMVSITHPAETAAAVRAFWGD
ncbi:alpha/beta hydrolase [Phaeobacter sp. PT47_59]|uniref:alpha/beta fold hydrolase n=1 Tax=Phaeobacter sp. PT47_59 TaxID=3029979 RepID=UPI0023809E13|nr:alpha/beta hydrolase [Phaeobacter sp. PT47_59]MDE4175560.1 alpha/beta hydrolase [Phaeobacter sp. PT47_59]